MVARLRGDADGAKAAFTRARITAAEAVAKQGQALREGGGHGGLEVRWE